MRARVFCLIDDLLLFVLTLFFLGVHTKKQREERRAREKIYGCHGEASKVSGEGMRGEGKRGGETLRRHPFNFV